MTDIYSYLNAVEFAVRAHGSQTRRFGAQELYVAHPIRCSKTVLKLTEDWTDGARYQLAIAAVLHDVLEDTKTSKQSMMNTFGTNVLLMVESVTKNTALPKADKELEYLLRFKQSSVETVLIKLADRLDNLQSMASAPMTFKKSYVANTKGLLQAIPDKLQKAKHVATLKDMIVKLLESYEREF